jgi:hypothetical protein
MFILYIMTVPEHKNTCLPLLAQLVLMLVSSLLPVALQSLFIALLLNPSFAQVSCCY